MDKNVLKKFAIESRQELMEKVANKINRYFVDEEFNVNQNGEVYVLVNEKHTLRLAKSEYENRQLLVKRIKEITLEQVIEEAAYTWFNRIIAIRYMEIHDYLPLTKNNQSLGVRVLSSKDNTPDPEIMKISNLMNPDLDIEFNKEYYGTIQDNNKRFEYILLLVCKKLGKVIPQVFDGITDYIDILIPDNLLNESGYITKLLNEVSEDNFEKVEIIGWLYQYYISEKKEKIFINIKKNIKVEKNDIPSATQLFTPDWIVKYMVENTLGRYFDDTSNFEYYIKDTNEKITENKNIEEITFLDPCCGSGHILVYAFELLYNQYKKIGYTDSMAVKNIFEKNIYGIDVDDRAVQLTILTLCLKARECDRNFFSSNMMKKSNIISIKESNTANLYFAEKNLNDNNKEILSYINEKFINAKEYGSLIKVEKRDYESLLLSLNKENFIGLDRINEIINQAIILSKKYTVVCTNPPYMGRRSINEKLSDFLNKEYAKNKSEMYSAFIERCNIFTEENGYQGMITIHTWMFITSFEETRKYILNNSTIINMLHTGPATFTDLGSFNVLATAFCVKKSKINYTSSYVRLADYYNLNEKISNFNNTKNYYFLNQKEFEKIPGSPLIYWIDNNTRDVFSSNKTIGDLYDTKVGLQTGNNDRFLRLWWEVENNNICFNAKSLKEAEESKKKWFPYNKGGDFRKWYGNNEYIVNWENDGYEIKHYTGGTKKVRSRPQNTQYYFRKGITWSFFGFENFGVRYKDYGFIFDVLGSSMFVEDDELYNMVAYLCSNVTFYFLSLIAPTVAFQVGNIMSLPYIKANTEKEIINKLALENIQLCKDDWDSSETSWDFSRNILIANKSSNLIENDVMNLEKIHNEKRELLRNNEEELNKIYIKLYKISNLSFSVNDRDLSIKKFEKADVIKALISYAVGCMFGRYSLDENGLVYTGGEFNQDRYRSIEIDMDNIIPLTEENYFGDDIVTRFKKFIEVVYGKETLYDNLEFIADILGKKAGENSEETIRRYFVNDFYNEHIKMYQKTPIYWLFDSGKKNGFKCLIYIHRYNEGLVSKIRLDYLHRMQNTYEKELKEISDKLNDDVDLTTKRELSKRQADISAKLQETNEYDEKIAHIADQKIKIDLDDGVVVNYAKFSVKNPKTGKDESILAKIK